MKFLPLVWSNLMRRKVRTVVTALSIFVAFLLFGLLMAIRTAFSMGADLAGADRLMMFHKVSHAQPLPIAYESRIAATSGVAAVTAVTWFGGIYQNLTQQQFTQRAVEPETFLRIHPEYRISNEQRQAWLADPTGCIVGRDLATRFGWIVGQRIPLIGTAVWRKPDGSAWTFTLDGIYDSDVPGTNLSTMFFHYRYINNAQTIYRDTVGWYQIEVADRHHAAEIAAVLDKTFADSAYETKTTTESAMLQTQANQIGDIGAIAIAIAGTVFFTLLIVTMNTMAQSVRERTNEIGVLKTLGFTNARILGLVLLESMVLAVVSGGLALLSAWLMVKRGDPTGGLLPTFHLRTEDVAVGAGLIILLGCVAGGVPAWQAGRLRIAEALMRQG